MWTRAKKQKIKHLPDEGLKIEHVTLERERDKTGRRIRYLYGDGNHEEKLGPLVDDRPHSPKVAKQRTKRLPYGGLKIEHITLEQERDKTGRRIRYLYGDGNHEEKLGPLVDDRPQSPKSTKQQKSKPVAPISFREAMRKGKPKSGPKVPLKNSIKSISRPMQLATSDKVEYTPAAMWQNSLEQSLGAKVGSSGNRTVRAAPQPSKAYRVLDHPAKAMNQNFPPRPPPKTYKATPRLPAVEVRTDEYECPPTPPPKPANYVKAPRPLMESTSNINQEYSYENPRKPSMKSLKGQVAGTKTPRKVTFDDVPQGKKKKSCPPTKTAVEILQTGAETVRESGKSMTSKFSHIHYPSLSSSKRISVSSDESFFCCGEPDMLPNTGAGKEVQRSQVVDQSWLNVDEADTPNPKHRGFCWLCTESFEGPEGLCPGCQKEYSLRLTPEWEFDPRLLVPEPLSVGKVTTPKRPEITNQPEREKWVPLIFDNAQDRKGKRASWLEDAETAEQYTEQERVRSQISKWAKIYERGDVSRQAQQGHGLTNSGHPHIGTLKRETNFYTFYDDDFFNKYQDQNEREKESKLPRSKYAK